MEAGGAEEFVADGVGFRSAALTADQRGDGPEARVRDVVIGLRRFHLADASNAAE